MILSCKKTGSGPPLVLVHAFPLSGRMWDLITPDLSASHHVITVDCPGFGRSPLDGPVTSMEKVADSISETLDREDVKGPVAICGVSMGGYIAFQFARKYPARLNSLTLISTRAAADTPEARQNRYEMIKKISIAGNGPLVTAMMEKLFGKSTQAARSPILEKTCQWIKETDPNAVNAALRGMAERPDSSVGLKSIGAPTLVVSGAEDRLIPTQEMETFSKEIPQSKFVVLENSGHLPPLEAPTELALILVRFLSEFRR